MLAYCGLICDSCPIYIATLESDQTRQLEMRESIAEQCNTLYGMNWHASDITDCDGCCADSGKIFSGCLNCEIRICARERNMESCAFCSNYPCDSLSKIFSDESDAKKRLEEIRLKN